MSTSPLKTQPNTQTKTTMKDQPRIDVSAHRRRALVPSRFMRGVSLRFAPCGSQLVFARCRDFATVSRFSACILLQIGGKAEIVRSDLYGYVATIERPVSTELVVEG